MRKQRILKIVILVVVAALLCAVFIYLGTGNYGASDAAKDALTSGGGVTVTQTDQTGQPPKTCPQIERES